VFSNGWRCSGEGGHGFTELRKTRLGEGRTGNYDVLGFIDLEATFCDAFLIILAPTLFCFA
jgi:hypothetical protein